MEAKVIKHHNHTLYLAKCPCCKQQHYTNKVPFNKERTFYLFCKTCKHLQETVYDMDVICSAKTNHEMSFQDIIGPMEELG